MLQRTIDYIEARASDVLERAYGGAFTAPINLERVIQSVGLTLQKAKFDEGNIAGYFDRATRRIVVSVDDPETRQSFTIAHEIGHFVLHSERPSEILYRSEESYNLGGEKPPIEKEADWFAASLLMPKNKIHEFLPFKPSLEELADTFRVSRPAMKFRLMNCHIELQQDGANSLWV